VLASHIPSLTLPLNKVSKGFVTASRPNAAIENRKQVVQGLVILINAPAPLSATTSHRYASGTVCITLISVQSLPAESTQRCNSWSALRNGLLSARCLIVMYTYSSATFLPRSISSAAWSWLLLACSRFCEALSWLRGAWPYVLCAWPSTPFRP
jgi:hypothetical protein